MFRDNKDFYPTPIELTKKLINLTKNEGDKRTDWKSKYKYILEPTAGDGKLIENYKKLYESAEEIGGYYFKGRNFNEVNIEVVENDQMLINILRGKDYNVVGFDFLSFMPTRYYDLILANFPFSIDCKCMLKAIEIQGRVGGDILAIINAETIKNPFSNDRKYLVTLLEKFNAKIEYIKEAFIYSERKTNVEVAIIYINMPMLDKISMFEKEFKRENPTIDFEAATNSITKKMTKLEQLCFEYKLIIESTIKLFEEKIRVDKLLNGFGISSNVGISDNTYDKRALNINDFIEKTNKDYWEKFIRETKFETILPSKLKEQFRSNMQKQKNIAFTIENIMYFSDELMKAIPKSYEETVGELFEKLTRDYNYTESEYNKNIWMYNSWKSNNAHSIKGRVIMPCYVSKPDSMCYNLPDELLDLNIVFNNIAGIKDNDIEFGYNSEVYKKVKDNEKKIETRHFLLSSFKKGTLHIEFKNKEHLAQFNLLGAKGKGWLDEGFTKKKYEDMTKGEKDIVKGLGFEPYQFNVLAANQQYVKLLV